MKKLNIYSKRSSEQLSLDLARAASAVKLVCGVANNATWLVMMDAHDQIKKHPNYRHEVKHLYKAAIEQFRKQEKQLLHSRENGLFHISGLVQSARKRYGDITDSQYFEYWQGLGAKAYTEEHKWVSSLANKYRLSLQNHNTPNADILSQSMTAEACLELCCTIYESILNACARDYAVPFSLLNGIFELLDLKPVRDLWRKALSITEPAVDNQELDDVEKMNIAQGIRQLHEAWSDPRLIYSSAFASTMDFEEIFRTKGEKMKRLREFEELMALSEKEMRNGKSVS